MARVFKRCSTKLSRLRTPHLTSTECICMVQRCRISDESKPAFPFKSTISEESTPKNDPKPKPGGSNKRSWSKRLKRWTFIGMGIGVLYYFAWRKLQRSLDNLDLSNLTEVLNEAMTESFNWYYKHLALGMIRSNEMIVNRFDCNPEHIFIVTSETQMGIEEMIGDSNGQSMQISFQITDKDQSLFATVNMIMTPKNPQNEEKGQVGDYLVMDVNGNVRDLHILLTLQFEDDEYELTIFDKILEENDYGEEVMAQWFSEEQEIEIELNGIDGETVRNVPDLNSFIDYKAVIDEDDNEKKS